MSIAESPPITTEQFLAMPDDGIDRDLIRGEIREQPMTKRNRFHTYTVVQLAHLLETWRRTQPTPSGEIHAGEVGTILRHDPGTTVGIDVAWFSAVVMARQPSETTLIDGAPVLAVEVLSPSDKHEDVRDKVREYIDAGVALVWIVDPDFQTVTVHRRDAEPQLFNRHQTLSDPEITPGLEIPVAEIFSQQSPRT